ncbi:phosphate transport system protein [Thermoflavifilum aggregans]|uniref:Phosphate-specific transport system accessory protein PhoU n=1 Tax=Thermoflavifilum aggregans TaxID=454188 RepID=A0A2M9CXT8_9BACT|nr:phosphate signaling complex protein PhoU [Thermoflavifilum aggregans]MBX6379100.1 phosphate signaling complex protein PhoU [Thermoflavifilum aggregans]PJJ76703.1 phosphate transport system protein [Thermoflavifilum aggregans]
MTALEHALKELKDDVILMWIMVEAQLEAAYKAMLEYDQNLAREVMQKEKRINAYELKIDEQCEDILARYQPVAIDLRFLLAVLKINANLERTADIADGIARYVMDAPAAFDHGLLQSTHLLDMYTESLTMLSDTRRAFEREDTALARSIFQRDEIIDKYNIEAMDIVTAHLQQGSPFIRQELLVLSIIRKLERVGDQAKNLAEEIIFYVEAKVLKHHSPKEL